MADDSYTLREVAELLGVSKRTLQRRIQEGAFPKRFLSPGRHGLETRIPAEDVRRVLEDLRRHGREQPATTAMSVRPRPSERTMVPDLPLDSRVAAYDADSVDHISSSPLEPSALVPADLESLRDSMVAVVREEREMFLAAVRSALTLRDREIAGLKDEIGRLRELMDGVRSGVERLERRVRSEAKREADMDLQAWVEALSPAPSVDVDAVLRELGELESMLGVLEGD
jgi:excisionase family DNA binding protein